MSLTFSDNFTEGGYKIRVMNGSISLIILIDFKGNLTFSSNQRFTVAPNELKELNCRIANGFQFMEPYINGTKVFNKAKDIPKIKSIKPSIGGVYERGGAKNKIFVYLGTGILINETDMQHHVENRSGCRHIFCETERGNFISVQYFNGIMTIDLKEFDINVTDTRATIPRDLVTEVSKYNVSDTFRLNIVSRASGISLNYLIIRNDSYNLYGGYKEW